MGRQSSVLLLPKSVSAAAAAASTAPHAPPHQHRQCVAHSALGTAALCRPLWLPMASSQSWHTSSQGSAKCCLSCKWIDVASGFGLFGALENDSMSLFCRLGRTLMRLNVSDDMGSGGHGFLCVGLLLCLVFESGFCYSCFQVGVGIR